MSHADMPIAKPKSNALLIIGLIVGSLAVGAIGLVVAGVFWVISARDQPFTQHDHSLIASAQILAPYYEDFTPSDEFEVFTKQRYFDGSKEICYEYDSPRDDEPYISVIISHERNRSDANMVFNIEWSAQRLGLNIFDQDFNLVEDNEFYSVGDRSRFGHITLDEEVLGHVLVARKNNSIYSFSISGYILDDPELWQEIFDQRINELLSSSPSSP